MCTRLRSRGQANELANSSFRHKTNKNISPRLTRTQPTNDNDNNDSDSNNNNNNKKAARNEPEAPAGAQFKMSALKRSDGEQPTSCGDTPSAPPGAAKLVFGLSSRTNRVRHDEYAERRRCRASLEQLSRAEPGARAAPGASRVAESARGATKPDDRGKECALGGELAPDKRYELFGSNKFAAENGSRVSGAASDTESQESLALAAAAPNKNRTSGGLKVQDGGRHGGTAAPISRPQQVSVSSSLSHQHQQHQYQHHQQCVGAERAVVGSGKTAPAADDNRTSGAGPTRARPAPGARSRSQSPERAARMARRRSVDEDLSTNRTESGAGQTDENQPAANSKLAAAGQGQEQARAQTRTRNQFNILPPPQLSMATTGKGSVVSYAKSRIYDKPHRPILSNPPAGANGTLIAPDGGPIPAAISSGFKPPKQVNVSKAREKWEGGEPFAKCKSRQRLAAKAGKKVALGTWSMTSVVATQQLQLQQALAQSSAGARPGAQLADPSVKVLTRGSVLERVQQFERAPAAGPVARAPDGDRGAAEAKPNAESGGAEAAITIAASATSGEPLVRQVPAAGSRQAQYKSRVSSIQQQQVAAEAAIIAQISPISPASALGGVARQQQQQQRRPSVGGRRSSASQLNSSSTPAASIPRFYHPNGKPNTYEIELQKKNIVACFDKLPDRKAQLVGPNWLRHFHSIALACNFSEYFKVPLHAYVKWRMARASADWGGACVAPANGVAAGGRKTSASSVLQANGTPAGANNNNKTRPALGRSSSVAGAAGRGQLARAASVDSPRAVGAPDEPNGPNFVTCEQFLTCWRQLISCAYDNAARFIHLLTFGQRNYLLPDDFVPLVQSIIDDHPGLKFLRAAPDFHMRYIETVIARIYFCINKSWTGKISLNELRHSNLLAVLQVLSQEDDINQITDYFSYEHFYVIYCKFWNLDQDHDLLISKQDLARHNDAAISSRIIDRIFSGIVSKQIPLTGKMNYSDFVWFLIAEEDKKHPRSIEYWFRLMDLDGDGYISMYEMEYFYYEQTKRLELMNIEALPFIDSACQILDLVNPKEKNKISLADLKRTKLATIFFDTFINLEKYLEHESREFVSTRDIYQDGVLISDWDRYASEEYENLVTEESSV